MNQLVPMAKLPQAPDPRVEQTLARASDFLREYTPAHAKQTRDVLGGQFQLDLTTPLPAFNYGNHRAFSATDLNDGRALTAIVCEPNTLPRLESIGRLLSVRHSGLCSMVAAGVVELSQPTEERFVVFFERMKGTKLSVMLAKSAKVPANIIISRIITPLAQAIMLMQEAGVMHGSINVDNVYYDNSAVLGPCVLEPCGYSQPYYYELTERMQAHPAGKGELDRGSDYYALAVLVLEIVVGRAHLSRMTPQNLARTMLRQGAFMALAGGREVPDEFFDFLWGMIGSGSNQRWNARYLKPWLEGKHYNIIPAPPPTEGSKPFECLATNAQSRREVAHLFRNQWDRVQETLSEHSLSQWVHIVLRQKEQGELIARHSRIITESTTKNETQRNEHISRLILLLDEIGPLQYSKIAFHPDGIAPLFAEFYLKQQQEELTLLTKFIEQNLVQAWVEFQMVKEVEIPEPLSQLLTKLDRARGTLRNSGLGFGAERLLYDLNPAMPCLSPLCRGRTITSLPELLKHLDRIAPSVAATQDPIDTHIAAFIASRLNITNEIKLYDLIANPEFANHKTLVALKLFAVAQHRSGTMNLEGLTHWVVQRTLPLTQHLRSHSVRQRTLQLMMEEARSGRTQMLGDLLLDGEIVNADHGGFQKAQASFKRNADRIEAYRRGANLDRDSAQMGALIAKVFAYAALLLSIYNIVMAYQ